MTGLSFLVLLGTGMPIAFVLIATTFVFLYMADRLPVLDAVPQSVEIQGGEGHGSGRHGLTRRG